ncbi:MAG: type II methionyl aminopeptidase [Candidatus Micrarchaeota archaeon]|nr:type II methionyl aminopeptidase [Candidatus Micrarchaeota archaeon]
MHHDNHEYDYEKLKEVGKISYEALQYAKGLVKAGASVLEVCEKAEEFIRGKGMVPAFPVNLSINEGAAHYTATINDQLRFSDKDLVKVDLGARSGDVLGDCAVCVDLSGKYGKLIETAEQTLESALSKVRAGAELNSIGREVEQLAKRNGFQPIRNLGGHAIEREELHASIFIPNYDNGDTTKLEEGQVVAIETFITTGEGSVTDSDIVQIFQKTGAASTRSPETRKMAESIDNQYKTYPFAIRWLSKEFASEFGIRKALNELNSFGVIESFPALVERSRGIVAQAEKEVIVEKDSCTVVTK